MNKHYQREYRRQRKAKIDAYFIYALCDPYTSRVRYIGYSYQPQRRLMGHLADARNNRYPNADKDIWLRSLIKGNDVPAIKILERTTKSLAAKREKYWYNVAVQSGCDLLNDKGSIGVGGL